MKTNQDTPPTCKFNVGDTVISPFTGKPAKVVEINWLSSSASYLSGWQVWIPGFGQREELWRTV